MSAPFALAVSPTGARKTRRDHPYLPLTPHEIAQASRRCLDAGACMLHLHVRKADGSHSLEIEDYRLAMASVRGAVGQRMVIQVTTESVGRYAPAQQIQLIRALKPEAASIALREMVPGESEVSAAAGLFDWMHAEGLIPQFILYSTADIERYFEVRKRGVIPDGGHWVLFVLGRHDSQQIARPPDVLPLLNSWSNTASPWAVCAFGRNEAACISAAMTLGGHGRVGFENNLHLPDGSLASENSELVRISAEIAQKLGYPLVDADALRGWFR